MSIPRPTRAQIELWASGHIGRIGWCRELENTARAYLALLDENEALAKAQMEWREALWLNHGHDGLYGDDGEMQCGRCVLDFKRDSLETILNRWKHTVLAEYAKRKQEGGEL